jgi:hypothetical protein
VPQRNFKDFVANFTKSTLGFSSQCCSVDFLRDRRAAVTLMFALARRATTVTQS